MINFNELDFISSNVNLSSLKLKILKMVKFRCFDRHCSQILTNVHTQRSSLAFFHANFLSVFLGLSWVKCFQHELVSFDFAWTWIDCFLLQPFKSLSVDKSFWDILYFVTNADLMYFDFRLLWFYLVKGHLMRTREYIKELIGGSEVEGARGADIHHNARHNARLYD